ncbi:MAG TPA: exosortase W [Vicinamibacterales bacterium]|nr:exosortase W [Vicinamibacterales bacterium]
MVATPASAVAGGAGRIALRDMALLAAVLVALVFAYREALAGMVHLWNVSPMYSYGYTVPVISVCLLWARRAAFARLTPSPSWWIGMPLALLALAMTVVADEGGIQVLAQLAFLVALAAAMCLVLGGAYVKTAWAALAYLLLMIPIWDGFTEPLHQPFQLRSAAIGVWLMHAVGVPAFREGTVIGLPGLTIEVARACSGVNYLVAVLALGLPLSYVYLQSPWRRIVLLGSALVIAALSNGLRVALIGVLAYLDIGSPLHGPFHVLHGLFVAGIGYVVLFAGLRLLSTPHAAAAGPAATPEAARPHIALLGPASIRAAIVLAVVFTIGGATGFSTAAEEVTLGSALEQFPERLGTWVVDAATKGDRSAADIWPGADAELARRYRRADGATADLYVAYFASQRQSKEIVSFRTADLHGRASRREVNDGNGGTLDVNAIADANATETWFWYRVGGASESNPYVVKTRTLWNAVWSGRSNGAVVMLRAHAGSGSAADALENLAPLVEAALADRLRAGRSAGT